MSTVAISKWCDLASAFKDLDGRDLAADWTFDQNGTTWRICGQNEDSHGSRLRALLSEVGILLVQSESKPPERVFPSRLLAERDPMFRWLSALRYLHLNVRVLSTKEWRVNKGLIWDVPAASAWLCTTLAANHSGTMLRQQFRRPQRGDGVTRGTQSISSPDSIPPVDIAV